MKRRRLIPGDIEDDVDKELAALPLGHNEGVAPVDVTSAEHKRAEYTARRQACMTRCGRVSVEMQKIIANNKTNKTAPVSFTCKQSVTSPPPPPPPPPPYSEYTHTHAYTHTHTHTHRG